MIYCEDDFIYETHRNSAENTNSKFDIRLQSQWSSGVEKGYFRYRLNIKHARVLPGKYSFLAQVNTGIHLDRLDLLSFVTDIYFTYNTFYTETYIHLIGIPGGTMAKANRNG